MSHMWKIAVAFLLVLALLALPLLGCADPEEGVIISIGQITDVTGMSATSVTPIYHVIEDLARYYNEEGLIPGVKIKIVTYDTRTDFARFISAYDWVKERGAKVVISVLNVPSLILKPFAERDKIPLAAVGGSMEVIEPPGWVFWFNCPPSYEIKTLLRWISEEDWDYTKGIPKVGFAGWTEPYEEELESAMREYCQAHPDKFQWVGGYLVPLGTMTWTGEVEQLKECDYIHGAIIATPLSTFVKQFQARGYTTTFIGASAIPAFRGFIVDACGWEALDGWLTTSVCQWWNEPSPLVDLAKELLYRYRPGEAEDIIHAGSGYVGGFHNVYAIFEILQKAIEEVGAENFDGQAFYNAAIKYKTTWEGYPQWAFTQTKLYLVDCIQIHEWSAEMEDMVRVSDWLPLVVE